MTPKNLYEIAESLVAVIDPARQSLVRSSIATFPMLNVPFFERTTAALLAHGFEFISDVELQEGAPPNAAPTSFLRYCFREADATGAAIYQVNDRPQSAPLRWMYGLTKKWPTLAQVIEFETEFTTGQWVATSNGKNIFETPPEVSALHLGMDLVVDDLHQIHSKRVREYLGRSEGATPVPVRDLDALNRKEERIWSARVRFRRQSHGLTEAELEKILRVHSTLTRQALLAEIEKILSRRRGEI